jgi:hypothetical protein
MRGGLFSKLVATAVVAMSAAALGACTSGAADVSLAQRACERLDECNALAAGLSVDDCTAKVQRDLDGLASGEQHDTEKQLGDCLEYETCSVFLGCIDAEPSGPPPTDPPPTDPPPTDPPPQAQTGQFAVSWTVTRAGVPISCAEVGAVTVQLHSVLNGVDFRDIFDCASQTGTTDGLPAGAYSTFMTIHDVNGGEMGRSMAQAATLRAGSVVTLGRVDWQVSQP